MFIFRRGCLAKYILVTFFFLFAYSFFITVWTPRESGDANTVVMNPDADHKMIALSQFSDKEESAKHNFKASANVLQPKPTSQNLPKPTSPKTVSSIGDLQQANTSLERTTQRTTQRHQPIKTSSSARPSTSTGTTSPTKNVSTTTPFPLGEDNTWNFTVTSNPHSFKVLKNASDVCKAPRVFMLNAIHSKPSNSLHRNFIRKTWGNSTANPNLHMATVFFLGKTTDSKMEDAVDAEYHKYHDIVQEDFLDSYRNLTYKAVAVLKWITNFCPNAEFVLKTDDDVFVNPFDINRLVRRQLLKEPNATKIMCQLSNRSVLRQKRFKWYVPETEYPYKRYPPYCMGTAFIMPQPVVPLLYNASFTTKFFWIDDVYSTGMLAHVANVSHTNIIKKFVYKPTEYRDKLLFGDAAIAHVGGGPKTEQKEKYWEELLKIEVNQT